MLNDHTSITKFPNPTSISTKILKLKDIIQNV